MSWLEKWQADRQAGKLEKAGRRVRRAARMSRELLLGSKLQAAIAAVERCRRKLASKKRQAEERHGSTEAESLSGGRPTHSLTGLQIQCCWLAARRKQVARAETGKERPVSAARRQTRVARLAVEAAAASDGRMREGRCESGGGRRKLVNGEEKGEGPRKEEL